MNSMTLHAVWLLAFLTVLPAAAQPAPPDFILGMDVSFLDQLEEHGAQYTENGEAVDLLALLHRHGVNTVRLRLWHTPLSGYNDLARTLRMAQRVRDAGLHLLLDFHYSDTWADPGHQDKPRAWQSLGFEALTDSVRAYTSRVMTALKNQGTLPTFVQVGNEISVGLLWNDGRVGGSYDTPAQWQKLATLLGAAVEGVRAPLTDGETVQVAIHTDRGGDVNGARWFFDNLRNQNVDFDLIALSFYSFWHGDLDDLSRTLDAVAQRYGKPVLVAETAYPWTLQWYDNTNNIIGNTGQLLPGYPATPEGQRAFLQALIATIQDTPGERGYGFVYWAPEWMAVPGVGSSWENLALFDNHGELLPAIQAVEAAAGVANETPLALPSAARPYNLPNPFTDVTRIRYVLQKPARVTLTVYDTLGRRVFLQEQGRTETSGSGEILFDGSHLPAGLYAYHLLTPEGSAGTGVMVIGH